MLCSHLQEEPKCANSHLVYGWSVVVGLSNHITSLLITALGRNHRIFFTCRSSRLHSPVHSVKSFSSCKLHVCYKVVSFLIFFKALCYTLFLGILLCVRRCREHLLVQNCLLMVIQLLSSSTRACFLACGIENSHSPKVSKAQNLSRVPLGFKSQMVNIRMFKHAKKNLWISKLWTNLQDDGYHKDGSKAQAWDSCTLRLLFKIRFLFRTANPTTSCATSLLF